MARSVSARPSSFATAAVRTLFAVAVVSTSYCGRATGPEEAVEAHPPAAPTPAQLAAASYSGIYDRPVKLEGGRYDGEPFEEDAASRPTVELVPELRAEGDLDRDGSDEAVVLLVESSGGSGSHVFLAAVGVRDGEPVNLSTRLVGDRVQVRGLAVVDGRARLDLVDHRPEDPACCPTRLATRAWELQAGELVETPPETTGTLSVASLAGDWVLVQLDRERPVAESFEITLTFEGEKITGYAGCNQYFGAVAELDPAKITIGPIGATKRACPEPAMTLETDYLQALENVESYGFLMGRLALIRRTEHGGETLLFERAPAAG